MSHKFNIKGAVGWDEEATESHVNRELAKAGGKDVEIEINSPGGYISEGVGMFNSIAQYKGHVTTINSGMAASMGSYLMMSGDTRKAYSNSVFMIHNALTFAYGNHNELRKTANILESFSKLLSMEYVNVTGKDSPEIRKAMDDESYYFGNEQKDFGFVDEIIPSKNKKKEKPDKNEAISTAIFNFSEFKKELEKKPESFQLIEKAAASLDIMPRMELNGTAKPLEARPNTVNGLEFEPMEKAGQITDSQSEPKNELNQNSNTNTNQKPQESKIMNLADIRNDHPSAYQEVNSLVDIKVAEAVKKEKEGFENRLEECKNFLTAESLSAYSAATPILIDVLKGESKLSNLTSMIAVIDSTLEKKKSKDAVDATTELDATPGQQPSADASDEAGLDAEGNVVDVDKNNKFRIENGEE